MCVSLSGSWNVSTIKYNCIPVEYSLQVHLKKKESDRAYKNEGDVLHCQIIYLFLLRVVACIIL